MVDKNWNVLFHLEIRKEKNETKNKKKSPCYNSIMMEKKNCASNGRPHTKELLDLVKTARININFLFQTKIEHECTTKILSLLQKQGKKLGSQSLQSHREQF